MRNVFEIGNTQAKAGEMARGALGSVELADGSKVKIPLVNVNGAEDGPVLTVVSGVHGVELSPIGAVFGALKRIDPASMRGALLAVTCANPLAVRDEAYRTPLDKTNLSGPWFLPPVDQVSATVTQRMAYHINNALEPADYVLDMHANPLPSIPFVITALQLAPNDEVREGIREIAKAFGVTPINNRAKAPTGIMGTSVNNGKPALTPELAGNVFLWDSITDLGTKGILNVMKSVGMLEGEPVKQNAVVLPGDLEAYGNLYAQRGGFMFVKKEPGVRLEKGETVVEIANVYGDVVEEIKMPVDGYCWSFTGGLDGGGAGGSHAVAEGNKVAFVFTEQGEFGE
jgi:hypothetical protein